MVVVTLAGTAGQLAEMHKLALCGTGDARPVEAPRLLVDRYRFWWTTGGVWRLWLGVAPLNVTDEKANATTNRAIVIARRTRRVSQVMCWACSHERAPLAPAAAAITHPAHMAA